MGEALSGGFIFAVTEEGSSYWMDVLSLDSGYNISSSHTKETNSYKIGDTVFVKSKTTPTYLEYRIKDIKFTEKGRLLSLSLAPSWFTSWYLESEIDILTIKK